MSTVPPPPPNDPPRGPGGTPAASSGEPQPTGPTYETPGYQPLYDPTTPLPRSAGQPPSGGYPPQAGQPQAGHPPQPDQSLPPSGYPQQELLPQDVKPGRSRKPLVIAVVVLALIAGGFATWWLLRDDGPSTREAYCSAIKELAPNDDLLGALTTADSSMFEEAKSLPALAPPAVADEWKTLEDVLAADSAGPEDLNLSTMLAVVGAVRGIIDDANDNCGTQYTIPGLP